MCDLSQCNISKERGDQGVQESTERSEKFSRVWKGYEVKDHALVLLQDCNNAQERLPHIS